MCRIGDLEPARVLKALFDAARPRGRFHQTDPTLTIEEARVELSTTREFPTLRGRILNCNLSDGQRLDTRAFNALHGTNAAENAIEEVRTGRPVISI